ncbi:DUF6268 family outer membrane beta-barrel protein [Hymenobacter algoricola]|uniref:DUF6268 domain-containing protein n=1 Tax=Hymenobacter algoricola TaxID=486267 RepID=A0ABP7MEX0_9BACT
MNQRYLSLLALLLATAPALAQVTDTTTTAPPALENFDEFGDVSAGGGTYNTQKVLYISPTKLISVGYEAQLPYTLTSTGQHTLINNGEPSVAETKINSARGLRLAFNAPVISRNNLIVNLGLTYWNTGLDVANPERSLYFRQLEDGLRTTGFNATVFKPFDIKHFALVQLNADASGNYRKPGDISSKNLTYSGTAIYGWKPNDNLQWGLGLSRTYRAGQLLYIPVVLYNRTFSPKWGCEVVFPARAEIRRNFGTNALLKLGYELEGNAYYLGNAGRGDVYLRRGELKPRVTYERKLAGFVWLSAQAGLRYNYRNDAFRDQNPTGERESLLGSEPSLYQNELTNPLYFNLSLNLVSP